MARTSAWHRQVLLWRSASTHRRGRTHGVFTNLTLLKSVLKYLPDESLALTLTGVSWEILTAQLEYRFEIRSAVFLLGEFWHEEVVEAQFQYELRLLSQYVHECEEDNYHDLMHVRYQMVMDGWSDNSD